MDQKFSFAGRWWAPLCFALLLSSCGPPEPEDSNSYDSLEFLEVGILQGECIEDCSIDQFSFPAFAGNTVAVDDAIEVTTAHENGSTHFCISYFGEAQCDRSDVRWRNVNDVELSFPCGSHMQGFLIEGKRSYRTGNHREELPSVWLAYANGEVAAAEGETPEALLPMFVCSGE